MLSFKRMTDIEECFAGNGDDGSLIERQLLRRASVKRESRPRLTKLRGKNLKSSSSYLNRFRSIESAIALYPSSFG